MIQRGYCYAYGVLASFGYSPPHEYDSERALFEPGLLSGLLILRLDSRAWLSERSSSTQALPIARAKDMAPVGRQWRRALRHLIISCRGAFLRVGARRPCIMYYRTTTRTFQNRA